LGSINKLSTTKLQASTTTDSHLHEHEIQILESLSDINGKVSTNDLLKKISNPLRVIALRTETFDSLRELAGKSNNRETFDSIIRKCVDAYRNKK
jgi:hypothetical protein